MADTSAKYTHNTDTVPGAIGEQTLDRPLWGLARQQLLLQSILEMKTKSALGFAIRPRLRVRAGDEIALGPGKVELLRLLQQNGSITEAAKRMGMSYMRAWTLIQTMNHCFKIPLVLTTRGGQGGGGAELTESGRKALEIYQKMEKAGLRAMTTQWRQLRKLLRG